MAKIVKQAEQEAEYGFNPLSWGMLFFSFWLSILISQTQGIMVKILDWFCFSLSIILGVSIFCPWLRNMYEKKSMKTIVIPLVFEITLASFVIGFLLSLSTLDEPLRSVVIYFGFAWIVTYLLIIIRMAQKGMGIIASIVFVLRGVNLISTSNNTPTMISGIVALIIGLLIGFVAIKRPNWLWHKSLI